MVRQRRKHPFVVTRTPLRISFAGGGTDLPSFYRGESGAVFSAAIDKYVYVTVKPHGDTFDESIRLNYSKSEHVHSIDDIENDIARECLRFLDVSLPIYISTVGDLPASTGLGGSSAFTVGLLNALHAYRGEGAPAGQLAEEAAHIEMNVLSQPIGKQDQYAVAYGGLNLFRFEPFGQVAVEPQASNLEVIEELFAHILLFWTGRRRDAGALLRTQVERISDNRPALKQMREQAFAFRDSLSGDHPFSPPLFGRALHEAWALKRGLACCISDRQIDSWYDRALDAGAVGGKLCGAGGGGFLMFVVDHARRNRVRRALAELRHVDVHPDYTGSQVLLGAETFAAPQRASGATTGVQQALSRSLVCSF